LRKLEADLTAARSCLDTFVGLRRNRLLARSFLRALAPQ
jgi:hypothetical protein